MFTLSIKSTYLSNGGVWPWQFPLQVALLHRTQEVKSTVQFAVLIKDEQLPAVPVERGHICLEISKFQYCKVERMFRVDFVLLNAQNLWKVRGTGRKYWFVNDWVSDKTLISVQEWHKPAIQSWFKKQILLLTFSFGNWHNSVDLQWK